MKALGAKGPAAALALMVVLSVATGACSPAFLGGAAVGALGTGGAYEYNKKREMDKVEKAFERGEISKEEYLRRKKEIEKGSITQ